MQRYFPSCWVFWDPILPFPAPPTLHSYSQQPLSLPVLFPEGHSGLHWYKWSARETKGRREVSQLIPVLVGHTQVFPDVRAVPRISYLEHHPSLFPQTPSPVPTTLQVGPPFPKQLGPCSVFSPRMTSTPDPPGPWSRAHSYRKPSWAIRSHCVYHHFLAPQSLYCVDCRLCIIRRPWKPIRWVTVNSL